MKAHGDWLWTATRNAERRELWRHRRAAAKLIGYPLGIALAVIAFYLAGKLA